VADLGLINGKRERHSFKTKGEADTFAELKRTERQNPGVAGLARSQEIKVDAAKAGERLMPHGVEGIVPNAPGTRAAQRWGG